MSQRKQAGYRDVPQRSSRQNARRAYPPQKSARRPSNNRRRKRKQRVSPFLMFWHWVRAILIALVLSMILRTFCFDIVAISSGSMNDTVRAGDIVLMTKFDYWIHSPARGDIVGFTPNGANVLSVKRIVGLPGETVEITEGATLINNTPLPENYIFEADTRSYAPISLPGGYFMLLGDNRPNSVDSRSEEIGLIARGQIGGKVKMVLWPISRFGAIE